MKRVNGYTLYGLRRCTYENLDYRSHGPRGTRLSNMWYTRLRSLDKIFPTDSKT